MGKPSFDNFERSFHRCPALIVRAEAIHTLVLEVQDHTQRVSRRCEVRNGIDIFTDLYWGVLLLSSRRAIHSSANNAPYDRAVFIEGMFDWDSCHRPIGERPSNCSPPNRINVSLTHFCLLR